jgi:DNA-binding MarR family transcriptional regulator
MASSRRTARAGFTLDGSVTWRLHTLTKLTDRVSDTAYRDGTGIGLAEARCLAAIGAFTPLSVNDLAQRANLNKGRASRAAQSLVDQGLVRKHASAVDGRGVVLTLTAKGERTWQRVIDVVAQRNAQITACLDERERRTLDKLLDRLIAAARAAGGGDTDAPVPRI